MALNSMYVHNAAWDEPQRRMSNSCIQPIQTGCHRLQSRPARADFPVGCQMDGSRTSVQNQTRQCIVDDGLKAGLTRWLAGSLSMCCRLNADHAGNRRAELVVANGDGGTSSKASAQTKSRCSLCYACAYDKVLPRCRRHQASCRPTLQAAKRWWRSQLQSWASRPWWRSTRAAAASSALEERCQPQRGDCHMSMASRCCCVASSILVLATFPRRQQLYCTGCAAFAEVGR